MGLDSGGSGARNLAAEDGDDDGLTPEERALADELDRYMKKPSRENENRADRRARRDYTNHDAEGVSLALKLDSLTGVRP